MVDGPVSDRLLRVVETMPNAFFSLDGEFRITYLNQAAERLLQTSRDEIVGQVLFERFPQIVGTTFEAQYRLALARGVPVAFEEFYPAHSSWYEVKAWPDEGVLNVSVTNINERRTIEVQQAAALGEAQLANARLSFLTRLTSQLVGVRTASEVFERLIGVMVPTMADWCTVVVPVGEELVRVAAGHRDPTLDGLAKRLVGAYPHAFDGPSPGVVVYRSQQPLRLARLARQIVDELDDSSASTAYGRTLLIMGDGPGLIVPIKSGEDVAAVLTSVRTAGPPFSDGDVAVMEQAATRVAAALDHARSVQSQRDTASALQAASLPKSVPTYPGLELAAGYRAASVGSQIGGDWYDAFSLRNGHIGLVVGDAAGHGLEAAALMTQVRNALRARLFDALSPLESLNGLSQMIAAQDPDAMATVICVVIDPATGAVTWASAGHPAPILVSGNRASAYLRGRPAPPIGVDGDWSGQDLEHRLVLRPSERLILFTDGLVERRNVDIDIGLTHLMILAEQTCRSTAAEACDTILREIPSVVHEDDVCLLIVDFIPHS
jgi:serine phosphatase RsbU (regulator of sigma subunit)